MKETVRAVAYVRISTDEQVKGNSPEFQEKDIRDYAQEHGLELVQVFSDVASGADPNREGLKAMLQAVKDNGFKVLLVWRTDRLARDNFMAWWIEKELKKHGVELISVTEPYRLEDPAGRLFYGLISAFADYEKSIITQRASNGRRSKASKGLKAGGYAPDGYTLKDGLLWIDPERSEVILRIFKLRNDGLTLQAIADQLNSEGLLTSHGKVWKRQTINQVLGNPVYMGNIRFGKVEVKGVHEAIIKEVK